MECGLKANRAISKRATKIQVYHASQRHAKQREKRERTSAVGGFCETGVQGRAKGVDVTIAQAQLLQLRHFKYTVEKQGLITTSSYHQKRALFVKRFL